MQALRPGRKSASMPDTCRHKRTKAPMRIACCRFIERQEHQQNHIMHLYLEQYEYIERQKVNSAAEHRILPGNERSQSVSPSDAAALVNARGATVEKGSSPEDKASEQQAQKNTTAAQQPEEFLPQPFSPQPPHAEMRPRRVPEEHETPRPETPRLHCRSCCVPAHLMCLYIQRAWAKFRGASKALYYMIRKRCERFSRKRGEPITENRFSEPTRLYTNQRRSRRWLRLLAKRKSPRPPLEAMKKQLVATEDKTFNGASEAGGANNGSSQGDSWLQQDVLAPVACREPAQVLLPGSGLLLETQAPAPSQNVDVAGVQMGTAAVSSGLPPDATSGQEQKGKGHTQDKPAPPRRVSRKRKRSSSEQRPSDLPQPPNRTGTKSQVPIMQVFFKAIRDLNKARQTADEL